MFCVLLTGVDSALYSLIGGSFSALCAVVGTDGPRFLKDFFARFNLPFSFRSSSKSPSYLFLLSVYTHKSRIISQDNTSWKESILGQTGLKLHFMTRFES